MIAGKGEEIMRHMRRFSTAIAALSLLGPISALSQTSPEAQDTSTQESAAPAPAAQAVPAPAPAPAPCDYKSVKSPPGQVWWAQQRWRYASDADAEAAYQTLAVGQSPWPDWFVPTLAAPPAAELPVGTRFQMAMAPTQGDTSPGGWGTFDNIEDVEDVREFLAVTQGFKASINRVIVFEVTKPLKVTIGPVGPQVDAATCTLLPGRWSQFNMAPPWNQRMDYLKILEVRPIQ